MGPLLRRLVFCLFIPFILLAVPPIQPSLAQAQRDSSGNQPGLDEGLAAYKAGRNAEAERIWTPLAEAGDAVAQYSLGKLYETGGDGAPNFEAAARWYAMAAEQGMAAAQNNLGLMYAQGRGVPRDPVRASQLWSRSANASNPMAQYNLGLAYFRGDGVGQDQVEAAVWFHLAADAGVGEAQFALGQMHRLGLALPQDDSRALSWYERAAEKGHKDAAVQAKRLKDQGIVAASAPDPVEEAARQKPQGQQKQNTGQRGTAAAGASDARQTSLVTKGADTVPAEQSATGQTAANQTPATQTGASPAGVNPAGASPTGASQGAAVRADGFQLESRLIRPDRESEVVAAPSPPPSRPMPDGQAAAVRQEPSASPEPARTAGASQGGTFLWLLSAPDEAQALSLLREAETDYAAVLNGQELSLLNGQGGAGASFYRLVVATSSTAEASAICARIRAINAQAFCATLVR